MLENDVKELRVLAAEHRNTVFEMEDRVARFPEQEQRLTAILNDLHTDREALRKLPIDPERKLPVFKITIGETEYTDRKEAAKALEDAVLAIKYADTPVKVGSFQGFDLTVTVKLFDVVLIVPFKGSEVFQVIVHSVVRFLEVLQECGTELAQISYHGSFTVCIELVEGVFALGKVQL